MKGGWPDIGQRGKLSSNNNIDGFDFASIPVLNNETTTTKSTKTITSYKVFFFQNLNWKS